MRSAAIWFVVAILAAMSAGTFAFWRAMPQQPGIDFVQFWGMSKAQRTSHYQLGSPYVQRDGYQTYLNAMAAESQDRHQAFAILNRARTAPTGTPLLYDLMGNIPGGFTLALNIYRGFQFAAFAVAVILLLRPLTPALCALGIALTAAYVPLLYDLALGNLNCFQLLGLVAVAAAMTRKPKGMAPYLLAAALVFLTLLKPNLGPATLLLGLGLLFQYRQRLGIVAVGLASAAFLTIVSSLPFGSWAVWIDWWRFTIGSPELGANSIAAGNYSDIKLLEELGLSATQALGVCAALLAAPMVVHRPRLNPDPQLSLGTGVILMLALSPLVWQHYEVMAVIPALYLCRRGQLTGFVSLLLFADPLTNLNTVVGGGIPHWLIEWVHAFGWVPAWWGLVLAAKAGPSTAHSFAGPGHTEARTATT